MNEREQLEEAITALKAQRTFLGDAVVEAALGPMHKQLAELEAAGRPEQQRKLVTVLFADLVGFTSLAENLDPEEVREVQQAFFEAVTPAIDEQGGMVEKYIGDAILAVFGLPQAQENDPDRGVLAGLGMQAAMGKLNEELEGRMGLHLQLRVGVNTGLVVVSMKEEADFVVTGDPVNLAARLESAAPPGGVLISQDTYQHIRGAFDLEVWEPIRVKGKAELVPVYQVLKVKARSFRIRRRGVEGVDTRMVGRDRELNLLQDIFAEVVEEGERQMVTVVSEAGLGKSRLLYEFENWVDLQPHLVQLYQGRGQPETRHLPYGLLRDIFAFQFGVQDDDQGQVVREKVVAGFHETFGESEQSTMQAHFVGSLLGYGFHASPYLARALDDPQQIHDRSLVYMIDYFEMVASEKLVLILLEDLHWGDDSSLDFLTRLTLALWDQPVLLVGAARLELYERRPNWMEGQVFHTRMDLRPLSKRNSRILVDEVLQKVETLPGELRELVVSNTEGNPFYLEELVKMLVADGVILKGEEQWHVRMERLGEVQIPPTLTGVLQARLEGLPVMEREVIQQGSVVGRVFWDMAVNYLNRFRDDGLGEEVIFQGLVALRDKEMVYLREYSAFADANEYLIKHAIFREVAYESMLKRVRQKYHALVAEWLVSKSGERAGEVIGLIADHLEKAGKNEEALHYLMKAGEGALAAYAQREAVDYFGRALKLLPAEELEIRWNLHAARAKAYGFLGKRENQAHELAILENLAKAQGDLRKQIEVTVRKARYAILTGDSQGAIETSQQALELAQQAKDQEGEGQAHLAWGGMLWQKGSYSEARTHLEQALSLFRKINDRQCEGRTLNRLGIVAYSLGDCHSAQIYSERALAIAREIGDLKGENLPLSTLGRVAEYLGDCLRARTYFKQALAVTRESGYRRGEGVALVCLGNIAIDRDDYALGKSYYEFALKLSREISDRMVEGYALNGLCDALVGLNNPGAAAEMGRQSVSLREKIDQPHMVMECRASLARAEQARGCLVEATNQVEIILGYLNASGSLDGTEEPLRIYLTCVQVLRENGDPRMEEVLKMSHATLVERAERIQDDEMRRYFLENVSWNREIVRLAEEAGLA